MHIDFPDQLSVKLYVCSASKLTCRQAVDPDGQRNRAGLTATCVPHLWCPLFRALACLAARAANVGLPPITPATR